MIAVESPPHLAGVGRYTYRRRHTRCVMVGAVGVGGEHPIRVQSMTTPATQDVAATVAQTIRLVEAGCEIVRVTVPTVTDARALRAIRAKLHRHGVRVPLVADIHFSPAAALEAAQHVEKVRVNPGNYADSKRFAVREYTDRQYAAELERVAERFAPLVRRCRELGVAMRIGTNHGSLSDRVLNRYGDTPLGMVESALEFVRICEDHDYYDVIFSMKASNPKVMIQAYRLLAARLDARGTPYPFHLGVTEAGKDEDGRIKSAIGTGSLLDDGIGDTVRVSLTEEPEAEIPVAQVLVRPYNTWQERARTARNGAATPPPATAPSTSLPDSRDPYSYTRRPSRPTVVGDVAWGDQSPVRGSSIGTPGRWQRSHMSSGGCVGRAAPTAGCSRGPMLSPCRSRARPTSRRSNQLRQHTHGALPAMQTTPPGLTARRAGRPGSALVPARPWRLRTR